MTLEPQQDIDNGKWCLILLYLFYFIFITETLHIIDLSLFVASPPYFDTRLLIWHEFIYFHCILQNKIFALLTSFNLPLHCLRRLSFMRMVVDFFNRDLFLTRSIFCDFDDND